ncbi:MAG: hypothetical protein V4714_00145 [Bacteroidota bacterium]
MGTLAVIITIIVAVIGLVAVGYNEFRSRNHDSNQKTDVPIVGEVLNKKQDAKDAQRTSRIDDFNPQNS